MEMLFPQAMHLSPGTLQRLKLLLELMDGEKPPFNCDLGGFRVSIHDFISDDRILWDFGKGRMAVTLLDSPQGEPSNGQP